MTTLRDPENYRTNLLTGALGYMAIGSSLTLWSLGHSTAPPLLTGIGALVAVIAAYRLRKAPEQKGP